MPTRTYNTFYRWVQQDDFLTQWANFIEHSNVDGLKDGYGITLGPKSNKLMFTLNKPRSIFIRELSDWTLWRSLIWDESWNIYKMTQPDNTPSHTLSSARPIVQIALFSWNFYIFHKSSLATQNYNIWQISENDVITDTWGWLNENWRTWNTHSSNPPALVTWNFMYWWSNFWQISSVDSGWTVTAFWFPDWHVVGITLHGTTIKVYSETWKVFFWDWVATSFQSSQDYWFRIASAIQNGNIDIVTSEDGDMYISWGYDIQRLTKQKQSLRLNDNSTYQSKLDFSRIANNWDQWFTARSDVYLVSNNEAQPWIYKFGRLFPWLPQWLHKILSNDSFSNNIDEFFDVDYYEKVVSRAYFWYDRAWTYWVDYFSTKDLTTAKDWYVVTDVFTGWTTFNKVVKRLRITTSYTSGTNFIKLYKRVNNESGWTLVQTINESTDEITRRNISTVTDKFVDIQWKIELHNDNQDNTPPILHEFMVDYDIIQA